MAAADPRDQLAQIAHITRVGPIEQKFAHRRREVGRSDIGPKGPEKVPRQRHDVFSTLAQRWHAEYPACDPEIQIVAEFAFLYGLSQVFVGGAHETERGAMPGVAPDALVGAFLYDPQELGL